MNLYVPILGPTLVFLTWMPLANIGKADFNRAWGAGKVFRARRFRRIA